MLHEASDEGSDLFLIMAATGRRHNHRVLSPIEKKTTWIMLRCLAITIVLVLFSIQLSRLSHLSDDQSQEAFNDSAKASDPLMSDPVNRMFCCLCSDAQYHVSSLFLSNSLYCVYTRRSIPDARTAGHFVLLTLLLCGDVEVNPGPRLSSVYPCGYCELNVTWSQRAICCDNCSIWYHKSCHEMSSTTYAGIENGRWICSKCASTNSCSVTFHDYELDSDNNIIHAVSMNNDSVSSIPSPSAFNQQFHSSPAPMRTTCSNHSAGSPSPQRHTPSPTSNSNSASEPLPAKSKNW